MRSYPLAGVKAVLVEVPEGAGGGGALVEERRRTGADRWDELWEGWVRSVGLGAAFASVAGPRLAIGWDGGAAEV